MFGRKKPDSGRPETHPAEIEMPPLKLRSGGATPAQPAPAQPTTLVAPVQPKFEIPKRPVEGLTAPKPAAPAAPPPAPPQAPAPVSEGKRLLVGRDIVLSGEITTCDQLVVEGRVEATLTDSRVIEIRETGYFKGTAEIDDAEIRGTFEGTLMVRGRLLIRATGKVTGNIRYGMLEVECGGRLSGDVQMHSEAPAAQPVRAAAHGPGNGAAQRGDEPEMWQAPRQ